MANIDDLKQNSNDLVIDMTTPEAGSKSVVNSTAEKKIVLGGKKTVVNPKYNKDEGKERVELDLSTMPKDTYGDDLIHESPVKDLLEGEESVFGQYLKNKTEEFKEYAEDYSAEQALKEENEVEEVTTTTPDGKVVEIDPISESFKDHTDIDDELESEDLSTLNIMDDEDFEDEEDKLVIDEDPIDAIDDFAIDEDTAVEVEPIEEKESIESFEESSNTVTKNEEPKKEEVDTSDIELDDNTSAKLVDDTVIVEEEDEVNTANDENDEIINHLKELATERIKPVSQKLDLSSFTILKKPTSDTSFLKQQNVNVAKWVLPGQNSIVLMKEFLGSELEQLREASQDSSSITSLTRRFRMIYEHIASPKPSTYEAWLKSTPYSDIDHYFFAIYIACYKGANFVPKDCSNNKCNETFLTDDLPIMDMVKFENNEAKEKFQKIYKNESIVSNKDGLYVTEMVPLSESIAISFKEPSVYSLIEIASLDDRFKEKYSSTLTYMPYIDALYKIDMENKQLVPIGYKGYIDNAAKTIKSKIQKFDAVLKTLPTDQFGPIKAYIAAINDKIEGGISYVLPAVTCPKCGTVSEETSVSAEEMVFTRYQLGNLVTTSLK